MKNKTSKTTALRPLNKHGVGSSAAGKGVSVEMCSCGAIAVTTRHGIDQCEECGKPV